jgi:P-type Ca2+ transporter type 2C
MLHHTIRDLPHQGLTSAQVEFNRQKFGTNVLTPPQREPWWKLFLSKFEDPVIRILIIAALIAIVVGIFNGEYIEGIGIIVAILLATILAFLNEYKADQEFDLLNKIYDEIKVKVIRDGGFSNIFRGDLVVGDLVYVEQGDEVPADGEMVETVSLFIDQSKLTGECEPIEKYTQSYAQNNQIEGGTYPVFNLYRSTLVAQGHGLFQVNAVGDRTEIGQLAKAITGVENDVETPLNIQLEKLSKLIGVVGLGVAGLTFFTLLIRGFITGEFDLTSQQSYFLILVIISGLIMVAQGWLPIIYDGLNLFSLNVKTPTFLQQNNLISWVVTIIIGLGILALGLMVGYPFNLIPLGQQSWLPTEVISTLINYFMVAVTIIVVAVPEGLAMSVTLSLAYSVQKMAKSNNLVRKMHGCETIGAATVICSDKTGTLTQNKMHIYEVNFPILINNKDGLNFIAEAMAGNSTADLEKQQDQVSVPLGNVTEGALLLWLDQQEIDYLWYRNEFFIHQQFTFSTEKKYMATLGKSAVFNQDLLHLKGAPEVVLNRCTRILTTQGIESLSNDHKETILRELKEYQSRGMRTLGFAYLPVTIPLEEWDIETMDHCLIWLGFVSILDPLRIEVPASINICLKSGIDLKIVTGDSPDTAKEIAEQIGLCGSKKEMDHPFFQLTGMEFNELDDDTAKEAVKHLKILSRACPLDKLRLVKLLQENGQVVAVTGDGTNDAAALKQAQVGLAMGSGTAIAKEASDIILLDDSFQSIINGIMWGRSLYENIQRFILFQLTINVVALGTALLGPFIGVELPLTVTQMLWVNLIMDTFAALALATEPPHESVMNRPPRDPHSFIISPVMRKNILMTGLMFLVFLVGFLLYLQQDNVITDYELSVFFAVFVFLQFWNLFNARCLGLKQSAYDGLFANKGFVAIASIIFLGQILIIQFGGTIFRTVPLSFTHWIIIILGTSVVLWIGEISRFFQKTA